ncbi:hypothetical protein, partial [Mesorhizobium tamadayense]|uniref:hypothetical protein n=1 Tax=Mesorhizobium tamadayense TaxID=425306 RepID=UPI0019804AA1
MQEEPTREELKIMGIAPFLRSALPIAQPVGAEGKEASPQVSETLPLPGLAPLARLLRPVYPIEHYA